MKQIKESAQSLKCNLFAVETLMKSEGPLKYKTCRKLYETVKLYFALLGIVDRAKFTVDIENCSNPVKIKTILYFFKKKERYFVIIYLFFFILLRAICYSYVHTI